jgi:hypothetical protein
MNSHRFFHRHSPVGRRGTRTVDRARAGSSLSSHTRARPQSDALRSQARPDKSRRQAHLEQRDRNRTHARHEAPYVADQSQVDASASLRRRPRLGTDNVPRTTRVGKYSARLRGAATVFGSVLVSASVVVGRIRRPGFMKIAIRRVTYSAVAWLRLVAWWLASVRRMCGFCGHTLALRVRRGCRLCRNP